MTVVDIAAGVTMSCHREEVLCRPPTDSIDLGNLQPSPDNKHIVNYGSNGMTQYTCPEPKDASQLWTACAITTMDVQDCVWSQDSSQLLYHYMTDDRGVEVCEHTN